MKVTISDLIAELVCGEDENMQLRLEAQAEALSEIQCIRPVIGQWLDQNDVNYLSAIFNLDDENFAKRFPAVGHVGHDQRQRMTAEFDSHLNHCQHCALKRGYDLELDSRIQQVWRRNSKLLLQHIDEAAIDLSEGEHLDKWFTNVLRHRKEIPGDHGLSMNLLADPVS